jgi:hypothetical protein
MTTPKAQNQCDGCRRGLPLVDGTHKGEGYDMIGCTAHLYADPLPSEASRASQEREEVEGLVQALVTATWHVGRGWHPEDDGARGAQDAARASLLAAFDRVARDRDRFKKTWANMLNRAEAAEARAEQAEREAHRPKSPPHIECCKAMDYQREQDCDCGRRLDPIISAGLRREGVLQSSLVAARESEERLRGALTEIWVRTSPLGDMADAAVYDLASRALLGSYPRPSAKPLDRCANCEEWKRTGSDTMGHCDATGEPAHADDRCEGFAPASSPGHETPAAPVGAPAGEKP